MTTINDRITKLEDAFGRVVPLLESIIETLDGHTGKLDAIIAIQRNTRHF